MRAAPRLAMLTLLALVQLHLHAQEPPVPPAASGGPPVAQGQSDAQPSPGQDNDQWNFAEDEQVVETWPQIFRSQVLDMVCLTAFGALALVGFFRKSPRLHTVTLVLSVLYLGLFKSTLITIVNVFGLVTWNLPILKYNLAFYLFAVFTLLSTVLWGRFYCGRICAFGALTQLMDKIVPARLRVEVPKAIERRAIYVKYGLLGATILYFFVTQDLLFYRYVEPFWMFTRQGTVVMWTGLAVLLLATVFVRNLYCRFLCPVGAFLGLVSNLTVFRIKRWSECKTCKICEKTCEWGAIRGPKIIASECVRCDDCERLYLDQQKCPHWLILKKKGGIAYMSPA